MSAQERRQKSTKNKTVKFDKDVGKKPTTPSTVAESHGRPLSEEMIIDSEEDEEEEAGESQADELMNAESNEDEAASETSEQTGTSRSSDDDQYGAAETNGDEDMQDNDQAGVTSGLQADPDSYSEERPVLEFIPPDKFQSISTDYTSLGAKFDVSNLQGKQLVFLTAPHDVNVTKIKDVAWERIRNGKESFEQNEACYSVNLDNITSAKGMRVMLPTKDGYKSVHAKINHVLTVRQAPSLKRLPETEADNQAVERPSKIPKREQPVLKQRFKPIGVPVIQRQITQLEEGPVVVEAAAEAFEAPGIRDDGKQRKKDKGKAKHGDKHKSKHSDKEKSTSDGGQKSKDDGGHKEKSKEHRHKEKHKEKDKEKEKKKHQEKDEERHRDEDEEKQKDDERREKRREKRKEKHEKKHSGKHKDKTEGPAASEQSNGVVVNGQPSEKKMKDKRHSKEK